MGGVVKSFPGVRNRRWLFRVVATAAAALALPLAALVVFCVTARRLVARFDAIRGSALACGAWLAVAVGGYLVVLR